MPLPSVEYPRTPMHTRTVRVDAYRRDDGLWDLEAELVDVKPHDTPLQSGVRKGGEAMHAMRLRVTVDEEFNVVDAVAASDAVPYRGYCETIVGDYRKLVGLNLVRGFRVGLRERLGEYRGCTHLTELAQSLPTAAIQAVAGDQRWYEEMMRQAEGHGPRPFQIDRCHALRSDGPAVQRYYPAWFRLEGPDRAGGGPSSAGAGTNRSRGLDAPRSGDTDPMRSARIDSPGGRTDSGGARIDPPGDRTEHRIRGTDERRIPATDDSAASTEERP